MAILRNRGQAKQCGGFSEADGFHCGPVARWRIRRRFGLLGIRDELLVLSTTSLRVGRDGFAGAGSGDHLQGRRLRSQALYFSYASRA